MDYSQRVGPRLDVTMTQFGGRVDALQRYSGESLEQAVARFCAKHSLGHFSDDEGASDCAAVRVGFVELHEVGSVSGRPLKGAQQHQPQVEAEKENGVIDRPQDNSLSYSWRDVFQAVAMVFVLSVYLMQWEDEARVVADGDQGAPAGGG